MKQSSTATSYRGWQARSYNRVWRHFTQITLDHTLALVDNTALSATNDQPRLLDVACGTGTLLARLLQRFPLAEAVGVDASADILAEARRTLDALPADRGRDVQLIQATLTAGPTAGLPLAPVSFDLITCSNALHYLPDPVGALHGLGALLAPGGQLILEDYARRGGLFPWVAFEWVVRRVDRGHVRAYTLPEARALVEQAELTVVTDETFAVDWLWHGWALRATREAYNQE
ncbi:MAG: class I SAM-dependent methyltransferase [Ktedonobacterales bacterium]